MQKAIASGGVIDDFVFGQNEPGVIRFHQGLNDALGLTDAERAGFWE